MIQAMGRYVIFKEVFAEVKPVLILTAKEPQPTHYEVVSVGHKVMNFNIGDLLTYPIYSMLTFYEDEQRYHAVEEDNIYAKKV